MTSRMKPEQYANRSIWIGAPRDVLHLRSWIFVKFDSFTYISFQGKCVSK